MRKITAEQRKNLKALVAALRSENFTQGHGHLVNHVGHLKISYCCLGVAGRIIGLNDLELEIQKPKETCPSEEKGTFLGEVAAAKFGFTFADQQELASMNDDGRTFNEIADEIVKMFNL